MRGRKKETDSYNETISFKITKDQKEIWENNKWIADEIRELVRSQLNIYIMKK